MATYTLDHSTAVTAFDTKKYAAQVFVKAMGMDTVGVVRITYDGLFELWRKGVCLGRFDNFKKLKRVIARHDDGSVL